MEMKPTQLFKNASGKLRTTTNLTVLAHVFIQSRSEAFTPRSLTRFASAATPLAKPNRSLPDCDPWSSVAHSSSCKNVCAYIYIYIYIHIYIYTYMIIYVHLFSRHNPFPEKLEKDRVGTAPSHAGHDPNQSTAQKRFTRIGGHFCERDKQRLRLRQVPTSCQLPKRTQPGVTTAFWITVLPNQYWVFCQQLGSATAAKTVRPQLEPDHWQCSITATARATVASLGSFTKSDCCNPLAVLLSTMAITTAPCSANNRTWLC